MEEIWKQEARAYTSNLDSIWASEHEQFNQAQNPMEQPNTLDHMRAQVFERAADAFEGIGIPDRAQEWRVKAKQALEPKPIVESDYGVVDAVKGVVQTVPDRFKQTFEEISRPMQDALGYAMIDEGYKRKAEVEQKYTGHDGYGTYSRDELLAKQGTTEAEFIGEPGKKGWFEKQEEFLNFNQHIPASPKERREMAQYLESFKDEYAEAGEQEIAIGEGLIKDKAEAINNIQKEITKHAPPEGTGVVAESIYDLGSAVVDMVPQAALFAAGAGPFALTPTIAKGYGQRFHHLRESGLSVKEASDAALALSAVEGLLSYAPVSKAMSAGPWRKKLIGSMRSEGAQEALTSAIDNITYQKLTNPKYKDKSLAEMLENMTVDERLALVTDMGKSYKTGALAGGVFSVGSSALQGKQGDTSLEAPESADGSLENTKPADTPPSKALEPETAPIEVNRAQEPQRQSGSPEIASELPAAKGDTTNTVDTPAPVTANASANAQVPGHSDKVGKLFEDVAADDNSVRIETPELVRIAKELTGSTPKIKKLLDKHGRTQGLFYGQGEGRIELKADIFKNPADAAATLAHEIGHAVDYLPDKDLKRGNILGRIASLKKNFKGTIDGLPNVKAREIQQELKEVTMWWRPWTVGENARYDKYRYNGKELYADAISVLFNNPEALKKRAPKFYDAFHQFLGNKPEVAASYQGVTEDIRGGKAVDRTRQDVLKGFQRAEDIRAKSITKQIMSLPSALSQTFADIHAPIYDAIKKQDKRFKGRVQNAIEQHSHISSQFDLYLTRVNASVLSTLSEAKVDWMAFNEYLAYHRILEGDRGEMANMVGVDKARAAKLLGKISQDVGPQGMKALKEAHKQFWDSRQYVIDKVEQSGLFAPELMKKIKDNDAYATVNVVEYMESKGVNKGVSSIIQEQIGTLQSQEGSATATVMKDLSLLNMASRNETVRTVGESLASIGEAKLANFNKQTKRFDSVHQTKDIITYLDKGEVKGYVVDKAIKDSFDYRHAQSTLAIANTLRKVTDPIRAMWTYGNVGFQAFNLFRDAWSSWTALPGAATSLPKLYKQALPMAWDLVNSKHNKVLTEMLDQGMLISIGSRLDGADHKNHVERLIGAYNITGDKKTVGRLLDAYLKLGQVLEALPKIAGYLYLKKNQSKLGLTNSQIAHEVRTRVGSPDFLKAGAWTPITNNVFPFSNSIIQSLRREKEMAQDRPGNYIAKQGVKVSAAMAPKVLFFSAVMGGFYGDDESQKLLENIPSYDLVNYAVTPLFLDDNNRTVYIRMPLDEIGRMYHGVLWSAVMNVQGKEAKARPMTDFAAGQLPGLNPLIGTGVDLWEAVQGKNPRDSFRGRSAVDDTTWEAQNSETALALSKYIWNNLFGAVYRFRSDYGEARRNTYDMIQDMPVLGRFIRVSDGGQWEMYNYKLKELRRDKARAALLRREAIKKIVKGGELSPEEHLAFEAMPNREAAIRKQYLRSLGEPLANALESARTVEEKMAVLTSSQSVSP